MSSMRKLSSENISVSLKAFGIDDIATGWDVKAIVENEEVFTKVISGTSSAVTSVDEYIDYLLLHKLSKMEEVIPYVRTEEAKESLSKVVKLAEEYLGKYNTGDVTGFISNNIEKICQYEKGVDKFLFLFDVTFEEMIRLQRGLELEVFIWLAKNKRYALIDNFYRLNNNISRNIEFLTQLFSDEGLSELLKYRISSVLMVLKRLRSDEKLKDIVERVIEYIAETTLSVAKNLNEENIMEKFNDIKEVTYFLQSIRNKRAIELDTKLDKAKELLNEYIKKNGGVFSFAIPIGDMVKVYDDETDWSIRHIRFTHVRDEKNRLITRFEPEVEDDSISKYFATNLDTDDYFTVSRQELMGFQMQTGVAWLNYMIVNDGYQQKLVDDSGKIVEFLIGYLNSEDTSDLVAEHLAIMNVLVTLTMGKIKENKSIYNGMMYGNSMLICASMERLLRVLYKDNYNEELYITTEQLTLNSLLESQQVLSILGDSFCKILRFYLCRKNNIGYNWRNKLAHLDIEIDLIGLDMPYKLLYLYMCLFNTVAIHFSQKQ